MGKEMPAKLSVKYEWKGKGQESGPRTSDKGVAW